MEGNTNTKVNEAIFISATRLLYKSVKDRIAKEMLSENVKKKYEEHSGI